MFGEVAAYVHAVPCCYLHSAVVGLKITDYPNAPCPFYPRIGHLSPPQALAQSDEAITLTPRSLHVTECSCSLIFLTPRFGIDLYKVRMYNLHSSSSSKRLCLHLYFGHFAWMMVLASHHLCWPLVTDHSCCFPPHFLHVAISLLIYTNCFETDCLFYFKQFNKE